MCARWRNHVREQQQRIDGLPRISETGEIVAPSPPGATHAVESDLGLISAHLGAEDRHMLEGLGSRRAGSANRLGSANKKPPRPRRRALPEGMA